MDASRCVISGHLNHEGELLFLQQGHEVMAMAMKGVLSELKNHCNGKHFDALPQTSRMRDNLNPRASSSDAGMGTIHHQHPLHPGKPSFGWEMGMGWEWGVAYTDFQLEAKVTVSMYSQNTSWLLQGELCLGSVLAQGFEQGQVIPLHGCWVCFSQETLNFPGI